MVVRTEPKDKWMDKRTISQSECYLIDDINEMIFRCMKKGFKCAPVWFMTEIVYNFFIGRQYEITQRLIGNNIIHFISWT